jgi:hypothetical protein
MKGGLSTRMGAALRHAGTHLHKQNEKRKLILLVTDGEPARVSCKTVLSEPSMVSLVDSDKSSNTTTDKSLAVFDGLLLF